MAPSSAEQPAADSAADAMRIGELAERLGITTRTLRYYEEIGLLPPRERAVGSHRLYDSEDEARMRELLQLRSTLGLSLAGLREMAEARVARAALAEQYHGLDESETRERALIARQSLGHVRTQLRLLAERRAAIDELETELTAKEQKIVSILRSAGIDEQ